MSRVDMPLAYITMTLSSTRYAGRVLLEDLRFVFTVVATYHLAIFALLERRNQRREGSLQRLTRHIALNGGCGSD